MRGEGLRDLQKHGLIGKRGGVVYQKKLKPFRIDKHNPRRAKITVEEDLGKSKQVTTYTTPRFEKETHNIPKKKNDKWIHVRGVNGIHFRVSKETGRIFAYVDNEQHGEVDPFEFYRMHISGLNSIRGFRERITKKRKGVVYSELELKSWRKIKLDQGY